LLHSQVELSPLICFNDLRIITFNNREVGRAKKMNYKVVVGRPIEYECKPSDNRKIKFWWLTDNFWGSYTIPNGSDYLIKSIVNKNELIIEDDQMKSVIDNDAFGSTHGNISVKDFDGNIANGNCKVFYNKNDKKNPFFHITSNYIDDNGVTHIIEGTPNWFYYWTKVIRPNTKIKSVTYVASYITGYAATDAVTKETYVSNLTSEYNDITGDRGIHTYHQTLYHENEHINIYDKFWLNGYDASLDKDNDLYPDKWEDTDPVAKKYKFKSDYPEDKYTHPSKMSAGFRYEEDLCHNIELNIHKNDKNKFNNDDWSFDIDNLNQGKQWKK
jgi:hypothetical protein